MAVLAVVVLADSVWKWRGLLTGRLPLESHESAPDLEPEQTPA
jgi:hypothetical protein